MLTKAEEKFIQENMTNFYHLAGCNTHVFGEPFLINGYVYYFDGAVVTLIVPRLKGEVTKNSLDQVMAEILKKHAPDNLIFWGETPLLDFKQPAGYKLEKEEIDLFKRELVFKTKDFVPSSRFRNYLSRAQRENLKIKAVKSNYYKADYTQLLAETHSGLLGLKSLSYYALFPNLKIIKFFEVYQNKKMVSIIVVLEVLPNYVCFAEIGYDKSFKLISGLVNALLIDYYLKKTNYISWGGCANKGIFNFKKQLTGKTSLGFYDHYVWYDFYKKAPAKWWLMKMQQA